MPMTASSAKVARPAGKRNAELSPRLWSLDRPRKDSQDMIWQTS